MAPETYYAAIQSGQSHQDAELHTDADCDALDGAARPLSGSVVGPETHDVHECGSGEKSDGEDDGAVEMTIADDPAVEHPTNDDGEPLCDGKSDGQCSRVVEEPGGACWQHD